MQRISATAKHKRIILSPNYSCGLSLHFIFLAGDLNFGGKPLTRVLEETAWPILKLIIPKCSAWNSLIFEYRMERSSAQTALKLIFFHFCLDILEVNSSTACPIGSGIIFPDARISCSLGKIIPNVMRPQMAEKLELIQMIQQYIYRKFALANFRDWLVQSQAGYSSASACDCTSS
jgi:hypothetical protein